MTRDHGHIRSSSRAYSVRETRRLPPADRRRRAHRPRTCRPGLHPGQPGRRPGGAGDLR
ncbi:hypothetical protein G5V59_17390 [Nocardioides sp. W3-2-3]|uniref:hypothetical protein n=1 Tax=Nocardioides convexus TaxID=2712224 RepID=UPI002418B392|nr:hypothetical protein [Nocardioides convexus]NHA01062.1 hypothetical protein [Nocardioides convexus]